MEQLEVAMRELFKNGPPEKYGDYSDVIVARLKADRRLRKVLAEFGRLGDHESRLRYVHALVKQLDLFLPLRPADPDCLKSQDYSARMRNMGNVAFEIGENELALQAYHMAVGAALPATVELTLAFSNRSAVYFRTRQYQKCLVDIELALAGVGCDDKLRDKLLARREQCRRLVTVDPQHETLKAKCHAMFALADGTDPRIPCASGSVSLDAASQTVVARRDINPGEPVAFERIHNTRHDFRDSSITKAQSECYQCHNEGVVSCDGCKFLFCLDERCRNDVRMIHKYECALSNMLHNEDIYNLRVVLKGLREYGSVESFRAAIESEQTRRASPDYRIDVIDSSRFLSIYDHRSRWNEETTKDQFKAAVNIACILQGVVQLPDLFGEWVKPDMNHKDSNLWFMGKVLLHLRYTTAPTMILRDRHISSPFFKLLKHSCSPNAMVTYSGSCLAFVAILPIKKGDEIFVCYNKDYEGSPRDERRKSLQTDYHIVCKCKACTERWPVTADLRSAQNKVKKLNLKPSEYGIYYFLIISGNKEKILELLPKICSDIILFYPYEPCQEISQLKHLLQCCIFSLRDSYNLNSLCEDKSQ